jgi:hypothetical protein
MQYFVNDQLVLSQVPEGPFAGHLRAFADSLIVSCWPRGSVDGLSAAH